MKNYMVGIVVFLCGMMMVACPDDDGGGGSGKANAWGLQLDISSTSVQFGADSSGKGASAEGVTFCYKDGECVLHWGTMYGAFPPGSKFVLENSDTDKGVPVGIKVSIMISQDGFEERVPDFARVSFEIVEGRYTTDGLSDEFDVKRVLHRTKEFKSEELEDGIVEFTWGDVD